MGERDTRVSRDADGAALGVAIFLNAGELREMGVDPEATDHVAYGVRDGDLHIRPATVDAEE